MSGVSWRSLALIAVVLLLPFGQAGRSGGGFGGRALVSSRITGTPTFRLSPRRPTFIRPRVPARIRVRSSPQVSPAPTIWVQAPAPVQRSGTSWLALVTVALVLLGVLAWVLWKDSRDP